MWWAGLCEVNVKHCTMDSRGGRCHRQAVRYRVCVQGMLENEEQKAANFMYAATGLAGNNFFLQWYATSTTAIGSNLQKKIRREGRISYASATVSCMKKSLTCIRP